jgi:DNA-binding protein H-NS
MTETNPVQHMIDQLSVADLVAVSKQVQKRILERTEDDIEAVMTQIEEMIHKGGISHVEVIKRLKSRAERPAKWRHPNNPHLIWCGRGRRPIWMNQAINDGHPLSALRA